MMQETEPQAPFTVSSLTEAIRRQLEERYDWVQVRGEISGFKKAPSGHAYFRLKDANAVLECVAWRGTVVRWAGLDLQDGVEVIAGGKVTVYPPRGQYQLVVSAIRLAGLGALQQQFEALKRLLAQEGLFDPERKKPLPDFPRNIAVITSPSGAAVRDFLRMVRQGRCPVHCTICPVLVQGAEAAGEIARMIQAVNAKGGFDWIVLCRGGGSLEDLWAFNEEIVARAVAGSSIPVVSAVGHEIDYTIADFAADYRAPTPTAAGQLVCDFFESHRGRLRLIRDRLHRIFLPALARKRESLEVSRRALRRYHPMSTIADLRQRLDEYAADFHRAMTAAVHQGRTACGHRRRVLEDAMKHELNRKRQFIQSCERLLHSYNPRLNLSRGYAICQSENGRLVQKTSDVKAQDRVQITVSDGAFRAKVLQEDQKR
ncbi:MAG: exodeoxyribonuclease VII large subunit [Candidatus Hinthialibacter sp.]